MLARMGTALHLPYEDANLIRTLNNLGEPREVASRFREANAYYLEALELTEGTAGGAASNVARSEYRVFINEHPELR